MVFGLITLDEEEHIFQRLLDYYQKLYQNIKFSRKEKLLSKNDIANIYYTYSGEETQITAKEKMQSISEEIAQGYNTPLIILRKKNGKMILLDGHRRALVAYKHGLGWRALIIQCSKDLVFGIEKMITRKIKDVARSF